jgi:hypothetical protein
MASDKDYQSVPTVGPKDIATPAINIHFPEVRFTDAIGRALGDLGKGYEVLGHARGQVGAALAHLGGAFEHAGDEVFARASAIKHVENKVEATEAETKFRIEADKISDAFEETNGNAAAGGLDAHMKSLEDLRTKIKGGLKSPESTAMYDEHSLRALGSFVAKAGKHSATQGKNALIAAEDARYKLALNDIYKDPDNPDNDRRRAEALDNYKKNIAPIVGEFGPKLQLKLMEMESTFDRQQILGIAKSDPVRATKILAERREKMMAADIETAEKAIEGGHMNRAPRIIETEINKDLFEKKTDEERAKEPTLRERLQEADRKVDGYEGVKDKDQLRYRVHQAVKNGFDEEHAKRDDEYKRNWNIVADALTGTKNPGVPPPKNMEELRAQGKDVEAAITALGKKGNDMIYNAFAANIARGKVKYDPVESLERFHKLWALSTTSVSEFLDKTDDVNDPKLQLNEAERKSLVKLRSEVLKNPMGDPRMNKYHGWMTVKYGAEMDALDVFRRTEKNKEEYDAFRAGMLTLVESWTEKNKRAPDHTEFMRDIAPELIKYKPGTFMFGFGTSAEYPAWSPNAPIPEKWAEDHQARIIGAGGQKLTDKELREDYVRYMFEQSLRPTSGATSTAPPPTTQGKRGGRAIVKPEPTQ